MGCLAFSFVSFTAKFGFYASKQVSNQRNNELELEREAEIRMPQNEKLVEFTRFLGRTASLGISVSYHCIVSYQLNIHEAKLNEVLKPEKC